MENLPLFEFCPGTLCQSGGEISFLLVWELSSLSAGTSVESLRSLFNDILLCNVGWINFTLGLSFVILKIHEMPHSLGIYERQQMIVYNLLQLR